MIGAVIGVLLATSPAQMGCESRAQTAEQVNACRQRELSEQDAWLNDVYKRLIDQSSTAGRRQLRDEEREWIRNRDGQCHNWGRAGDVQCLIDLTKARADQLERRLGHI